MDYTLGRLGATLGSPHSKVLVIMSVSNRRACVQAKLKELIERASSAADANLHCKSKPYPLGFAVRANGSKFAFRPEGIGDNDTTVARIKTLFQQNNVVCYVLTLAAISKGKQFVLFTAEDEFGLMVGHREIIMQPAPHDHLRLLIVTSRKGDLSVCFQIRAIVG